MRALIVLWPWAFRIERSPGWRSSPQFRMMHSFARFTEERVACL